MTVINQANDRLVRRQISDALTTLENNLNYASGSWTPTIQDGSLSDAEGQTYSKQSGEYTRVANWVFFSGRIVMTSLGTLNGSSTIRIAGLPETSGSNNPAGSIVVIIAKALAITAGVSIVGYIGPSVSYGSLRTMSATTGDANMTITELTAAGELRFTGMYRV